MILNYNNKTEAFIKFLLCSIKNIPSNRTVKHSNETVKQYDINERQTRKILSHTTVQ